MLYAALPYQLVLGSLARSSAPVKLISTWRSSHHRHMAHKWQAMSFWRSPKENQAACKQQQQQQQLQQRAPHKRRLLGRGGAWLAERGVVVARRQKNGLVERPHYVPKH